MRYIFRPSMKYRRRLLMGSAVYFTYSTPWLTAPSSILALRREP